MGLQPCLVGGQIIILVIPVIELRENVPIAKKPKEAPGSFAAAKRPMVTDERPALAVNRASTIVAGILGNMFVSDIFPAQADDPDPGGKVRRLRSITLDARSAANTPH